MPIENMEEEGLQKVPNLEVAQVKFQLQHCAQDAAEKKRLRDELMDGNKHQSWNPCKVSDKFRGEFDSSDNLGHLCRWWILHMKC